MRIGFDVSQTCVARAGCAWYADSLVRAMVEVAPEHSYWLYHQFGNWINESTVKGTNIEYPSVHMPFRGMASEEAREFWSKAASEETLPGNPDIVFYYGAAGDLPVVGHWAGLGQTTIGVYRSPGTAYNRTTSGEWLLRNSNTPGNPFLLT